MEELNLSLENLDDPYFYELIKIFYFFNNPIQIQKLDIFKNITIHMKYFI